MKFCPIKMIRKETTRWFDRVGYEDKFVDNEYACCEKEKCEWYDTTCKQCAIKLIASRLELIYKKDAWTGLEEGKLED